MLKNYRTLDERFRALGFCVGIPYRVYTLDLSRQTMLIVEGVKMKGYATYRYTFYKRTYLPNGKKREKVYAENVSASRVLHKVASFLDYIGRSEASG
ncbi:hypothetical protein WZ76_15805 [Shouchella clausii]|nr:hypothetical protein WZ76_15805 [Shouchella clausii]